MNDSGPIGGKKPLSSSTKSAAMAMCDTLAEFSKLDSIAIACENLILEFDDLLDSWFCVEIQVKFYMIWNKILRFLTSYLIFYKINFFTHKLHEK